VRAVSAGAPGAAERGVALVVVLWFVTALAAMALAFTTLSRAETVRSRDVVDAIRARAVLAAALERTVEELGRSRVAWRTDGSVQRWAFDGAEVKVRIEGESGKLDLNSSDEQLVLVLIQALGFEEERAAELADALLDWRDGDDLRRLHGAEDRDYRRAGRAHGAADAPFVHVRELRELLPMDEAAFLKLRPFATVYTGLPRPEPALARPLMRKVLAGLPAAEADGPVADASRGEPARQPSSRSFRERAARPGTTAGAGVADAAAAADGAEPRPSNEAGTIPLDPRGLYSVRLDVRLPQGYEAHADAVIWLEDSGEQPYRVLDWDPAPLRLEEAR
jgi:general secretion pathway protein K